MRGLKIFAAMAALLMLGVADAEIGGGARDIRAGDAPPEFQNDLIAYAAFQADISDLAAMPIDSESDLDRALDRAARHHRDRFVRGWMTYGADIFAQSPAFVEGVRATLAAEGRSAFVTAIAAEPATARGLPGADDATGRALDTFAADAQRVARAADRFLELSYALQATAWGGGENIGQDVRLARLRERPDYDRPGVPISVAAQLTPTDYGIAAASDAFGGRRFWDSVYGDGQRAAIAPADATPQPLREEAAQTATLDAMAAIAALRIADAGPRTEPLLRDDRALGCIEMAQLQFYQCLSAARFVYENGACLAEHGLRSVARCMSGAIPPPAPRTLLAALEKPAAPSLEAETAPELEGATEAGQPLIIGVEQSPIAPIGAPSETATAAEPADDEAESAAAQAKTPEPPTDHAADTLAASIATLGVGELFARADELDEAGAAVQARAVRRALIARFPESPLAMLAAQRLSAD